MRFKLAVVSFLLVGSTAIASPTNTVSGSLADAGMSQQAPKSITSLLGLNNEKASAKKTQEPKEDQPAWSLPVDVYAEYLSVKPRALFDSSASASSGMRFGARWNLTDYPYKLGLQVGYVSLGEVSYNFPQFSTSSGDAYTDLLNAANGLGGNVSDRRSYGFPAAAHQVTDTPKGVEFGGSLRIPLQPWIVVGMHADYLFDMSSPKITGVTIPDVKTVRGNGFSVGADISYRMANGFELLFGYEHLRFSNHLESEKLGPLINKPREFGAFRFGAAYAF